jgi:hypothetical protein
MEEMELAVRAVKDKQMSQHAAAKYYGVPKSTLNDRIRRKVKMDAKPGNYTTLFKDDERALVAWAQEYKRIGHPRNPIHIRNRARELAMKREMDKETAKKCFTQTWFTDFMKQHNTKISVRKTQALEKSRAELIKEDLEPFNKVLDGVLKEHLILLKEPWQISNADESGRMLDVFQRLGIFEKRQKSAHTIVSGNREHCTLLAHIKADGTAYPPCFIFQGKKLPVNCLKNAPPGAGAWCQENAWMDSPAFYHHMTDFYYLLALKEGEISAQKPLLLILDGHKTHVTLDMIEFGIAHHIYIVTCAPNSSHLSQPLDLRCFSTLLEFVRQAYM